MPESGDGPRLPVGWCFQCGREVLAYVEGTAHGERVYRCVHCDTPLTHAPEGRPLAALEAYALVDPRGCGACACGRARGERG